MSGFELHTGLKSDIAAGPKSAKGGIESVHPCVVKYDVAEVDAEIRRH
jgi:hypothetical protein